MIKRITQIHIFLALVCLIALDTPYAISARPSVIRNYRNDPLRFYSREKNLNLIKPKETHCEREFVFVVPSYNNAKWAEKNLLSLLNQNYTNYTIIYTDDASTDSTFDIVEKICQKHPKGHLVKLVKNPVNLGAMRNLYNMIKSCNDQAIIAIVDGDDWLPDDNVLKTLNTYYANETVWMTYGQYLTHPYQNIGVSRPVPQTWFSKKQYRKEHRWIHSHMRTFYAGLFKNIPVHYFMFDGRFASVSCDVVAGLPLMDQCGPNRVFFIPELIYIYNSKNPMSDQRIRPRSQARIANAARDQYVPLKRLKQRPVTKTQSHYVDCIIYSYDRPLQLYALLESFFERCRGYGSINVIVKTSSKAYKKAYQNVQNEFPKATFVFEDANTAFDKLTCECMLDTTKAPNPYIMFLVDDIIFTRDTSLEKAAKHLDQHNAKGFYLRLGTSVNYCFMLNKKTPHPSFTKFSDRVLAWQFKTGKGDWAYPHTLDGTIYKKKTIKGDICSLRFSNPNFFESRWARKHKPYEVGLCYEKSRLVNIVMNTVSDYNKVDRIIYSKKECLDLFLKGHKIDISEFYKKSYSSPHISCKPKLVLRDSIEGKNNETQ